jgi:FkbM family methyltransferase
MQREAPSVVSRLRPAASLLPERVRSKLAFALAYSTELKEPVGAVFLREWSERGRRRNRTALAASAEGRVRAVGIDLDPRTDPGAVREVILDREYDWPGFVPERGATVLDVGAQHGEYSILCAVHSGASVLAFEPLVSNCALIEANVRRNGNPPVRVFPIALGDRDGELVGYRYDTMVVRDPGLFPSRPEHLPQRRLDSMGLESLVSGPTVILKVDVEGFEREVLDGAAQFIAHLRPRLILETDAMRVVAVEDALRRMGYAVVHRKAKATGEILFAAFAQDPSRPPEA